MGDIGQTDLERIAVLCVGNILMLDEGLGPHVAKRLAEGYAWPDNVEVLDAATMGYSLVSEFAENDYVVVVDAVDSTGKPPGTVFTFAPDDMAQAQVWHGAHDTRLADVLEACKLMGACAEVDCVGVQVEQRNPERLQIGLSPAVEEALPLVCDTVLSLLCSRGVRVEPRISDEL